MAGDWLEVADRVLVRAHEFCAVNVGLVVGDGQALLVDTLATPSQVADLLAAVRRVTAAPLVAVNTHAHFDHCFGNGALGDAAPIWAHRGCAADLVATGEVQRRAAAGWLRQRGDELLATELEGVGIRLPTDLVDGITTIVVGGRTVVLRHLGLGHTDHDLVVEVVDAGVIFAGDLVEEGGPPAFEDAYPLDWPVTNRALLKLVKGPVVPGHGRVVDAAFVRAQTEELAELARGVTGAPRAVGGPFDEATRRVAFGRAQAQLAREGG
ncbi:MAG: MBL fold metallo-hydrolase [Mycobacteriales bacterium]